MSDLSNAAPDLDAVLSLLIPAGEGGLPAAGELGLSAQIVAKSKDDPDLASAVSSGLDALSKAARAQDAKRFAALSEEQRLASLAAVNETLPNFVQSLLPPTYIAYYGHPRVAKALGMETWPPHPEGFPLDQGDLSLLDPVRERGPRYREI